MSLTIALPREIEESLRADAINEHLSVEELASRRVQKADLIRRIFSYFPAQETREMRSLARKRRAESISDNELRRYIELARQRELRNAERLADILALSHLRGMSVWAQMDQLGIRPFRNS